MMLPCFPEFSLGFSSTFQPERDLLQVCPLSGTFFSFFFLIREHGTPPLPPRQHLASTNAPLPPPSPVQARQIRVLDLGRPRCRSLQSILSPCQRPSQYLPGSGGMRRGTTGSDSAGASRRGRTRPAGARAVAMEPAGPGKGPGPVAGMARRPKTRRPKIKVIRCDPGPELGRPRIGCTGQGSRNAGAGVSGSEAKGARVQGAGREPRWSVAAGHFRSAVRILPRLLRGRMLRCGALAFSGRSATPA